jgi:CheY-like chemotaxis protein
MENYTGTTTKPKTIGKDVRSGNGLQNLAEYYQDLFDIEENFNHYNWNDYQNAKRKFVKYLMKCRAV